MDNNIRTCSICDKELTSFGNMMLKDGILCRDCLKECSEWINVNEYEKKSIEDIRKHLRYRRRNQKKLESFNVTRTIEGKYTIYIDEINQQFAVSKRKDFRKDNADIIRFKDIKELSIAEEKYLDTDAIDIVIRIKTRNRQVPHLQFNVNEFSGIDKNSEVYQKSILLSLSYLNALRRYCDDLENEIKIVKKVKK